MMFDDSDHDEAHGDDEGDRERLAMHSMLVEGSDLDYITTAATHTTYAHPASRTLQRHPIHNAVYVSREHAARGGEMDVEGEGWGLTRRGATLGFSSDGCPEGGGIEQQPSLLMGDADPFLSRCVYGVL